MKNLIIKSALATAILLTVTSCAKKETEVAQPEVTANAGVIEAPSKPAPESPEVKEVVEDVRIPEEIPDWMPQNVTILPSGLGIVIERPGNDKRASQTTPVTLHYRGRLTDGKIFDSSYERGEPATFSAVQVIPGFGEGIRQIGEGGKATLYIPSNLGYGPGGAGSIIPPNTDLIFDIEILNIAQ